MRRREPAEKNFFEGNVKLSRLATSMNNVFKTIQEAGLAEGVEEALANDIRVISDSGDNSEFEQFVADAAAKCASAVLEMLESL